MPYFAKEKGLKIKFRIPGVPVPYVRTTQKAKYVSKQYQRYKKYSQIVRISYLLAISELKLKLPESHEQISTTSQKEYWIAYRKSLMQTIGSADRCQQNFVEVEIYKL